MTDKERTKHPEVIKARQLAEMIKDKHPEKASEINKVLDDFESGKREEFDIMMEERATLRKFDGDYADGKEPVEVLEFDGIVIKSQHSQPTQS